MPITTLGIDLAKNVFQLHGVDKGGRAVLRRRVKRSQLLEVVTSDGKRSDLTQSAGHDAIG